MIPEEVMTIATTLAEESSDEADTYEDYIHIAYIIFRRLKFCQCD